MPRPKKINEKVVANIVHFGGDIDKERPVDFFFYFPSEYAATQIEVKLINLGFDTVVDYFKHDDKWSLTAKKKMKISTERINEISRWFEQIAVEQEGVYDGWGAPI